MDRKVLAREWFEAARPRIHELPKLLDECVKINPKLEQLRDSCELLAGFYVETRYPPDIPDYTKGEISKALEAAKRVLEVIEIFINKTG